MKKRRRASGSRKRQSRDSTSQPAALQHAALEQLEQLLKDACHTLRASSCTFYVRDKHWKEEYRLAGMHGVKVPETMHGLLYPLPSRDVVTGGGFEEYIDHLETSPDMPQEHLRDVAEGHRHLFQDFARREGVRKAAKLKQRGPDGSVDAVLFVNYAKNVRFDRRRRAALKHVLQRLAGSLDAIREALSTDDAHWLSAAARVVSPMLSVVNLDLAAITVDDYFTRVLTEMIDAFGVQRCLGTIHTFNAEEQALTLRGFVGKLQYKDRAERHLVTKGEGVISWVARRQRALLIADLADPLSNFRSLHVWLNDRMRSEMAVPVEAGGELIGVICLESEVPGAFRPHHVRSAWYAANRLGIFFQLKWQTDMTAALLDLCSEATLGIVEARGTLVRLAELAREYLKASYSDISCFSPEQGEFVSFGASYGDSETRARLDG